MKFDAQDCELVFKKQLTNTIYDLRLKNKSLAEITKPGQFVQILVPSKTLRRPISVCDVDKDTIRLVFEIRGEGTQILSETKVGEFINIIAPLGKGFDIDPDKKTIFIGGGIGVPPMLYSAKQCGKNATVINGFRNQKAVILEEDFKSFAGNVIITTDDGSYGIHGFVTQPLQEYIKNADMACACGPMPMLKVIAEICKEHNKPCQVSLEERMGCGIGACLVCACKTLDKDGNIEHSHVCKKGPVYNAEEVVW